MCPDQKSKRQCKDNKTRQKTITEQRPPTHTHTQGTSIPVYEWCPDPQAKGLRSGLISLVCGHPFFPGLGVECWRPEGRL